MAEEFTKGSSSFVSLHACKYSSSEEREVKGKTIRSEQDRKKAERKKRKRNIGKVWRVKFSVYACSCQAVFGLHFSSLHPQTLQLDILKNRIIKTKIITIICYFYRVLKQTSPEPLFIPNYIPYHTVLVLVPEEPRKLEQPFNEGLFCSMVKWFPSVAVELLHCEAGCV